MKRTTAFVALVLAALIISLPVCFAVEVNLTYDANGNLVSGDGKYRVYNSLNQLSAIYNGTNSSGVLLQTYEYDPVEERISVKKTYNATGAVIETVLYFDQDYVRVINVTGTFDTTYIYQNNQLVAQRNPDGTIIYIHGDVEGSSNVVTNSTGAVIENTSYSPFGGTLTGNAKTRYGYEAKESDNVVGDTDFHFRKYLPQYGIFAQPDTVVQNAYDPQTLNHYAFELNNPYNKIDPKGHNAQVVINKKKQTVDITSTIYIYGEGATAKKAKQIKQQAEAAWNKKAFIYNGVKYKVNVNIAVIRVDGKPEKLSKYENAIEILPGLLQGSAKSLTARSESKGDTKQGIQYGTWTGGLSIVDKGAKYAHEVGHLFGLKDRYTDTEFGSIPDQGYEKSIMSGGSKSAEQKDINNLFTPIFEQSDKINGDTTEHLLSCGEFAGCEAN